ncbi:MAG: hypothetical protein ACE3L7_11315 [Candidatus Pristimantibacillus sp.]
MSGSIISTLWQGMIIAAVIIGLLFTLNYRMLMNTFSNRKEEDFQYSDTYFATYHGILENHPILALLFWVLIIIIVSIVLLGIGKAILYRFK